MALSSSLLQHHLDTGQMYDRAKLTERQVAGIRYITCMDPHVGAGVEYRPNTARLLRLLFSACIMLTAESSHDLHPNSLIAPPSGATSMEPLVMGLMALQGAICLQLLEPGSYAMFESGARGVASRLVQATLFSPQLGQKSICSYGSTFLLQLHNETYP